MINLNTTAQNTWCIGCGNFSILAAMKAEQIGGTYWAAGGWWGKYPLSVEPRDDRDRPQMEVLSFYAGSRQKPKDAKPSYAEAARMLADFRGAVAATA